MCEAVGLPSEMTIGMSCWYRDPTSLALDTLSSEEKIVSMEEKRLVLSFTSLGFLVSFSNLSGGVKMGGESKSLIGEGMVPIPLLISLTGLSGRGCLVLGGMSICLFPAFSSIRLKRSNSLALIWFDCRDRDSLAYLKKN